MNEIQTVDTEYDCPNGCDRELEYGRFVDAREGIRGYSCPNCEYIWTTSELKRKGVIEE